MVNAWVAVSDFEGKDITPETYQSIKNEADEATNVDIIYGGLYTLLKCALSIPVTSLKKEVFKGDLKELQIPEDYVEDLVNVVYGPRCSPIRASLMKNAPHLNKLEKLGWRLDVAISTSALSRVLEPTIVMEMTVDGDRKETFEVQPSQFHQLRFAVASLLKEMENLEKKNVLKN